MVTASHGGAWFLRGLTRLKVHSAHVQTTGRPPEQKAKQDKTLPVTSKVEQVGSITAKP